jgi:hypothetical protein
LVGQDTISFSTSTVLHAVKQSVGCLSLGIWFHFLVFTEQVLFFCTHKHRTLTLLSSIIQYIPSSLSTTILELWLPGAATQHVTITSLSLPIYSTLKYTYVTEYDRRSHSDAHTEWITHEVTKCNQMPCVYSAKRIHKQDDRSELLITEYRFVILSINLWFELLTPGVGSYALSCSGKVPRNKFIYSCGLKRFLTHQFWKIAKCMAPNPLYQYMKLWILLERILCAETRFVLVRANDDFYVIVQQA